MPTFLLFLVIMLSLHIYLPICYKTYNLLFFNLNNYLSTQNCFEEPHNLNFYPKNFILLSLSYFSEFLSSSSSLFQTFFAFVKQNFYPYYTQFINSLPLNSVVNVIQYFMWFFSLSSSYKWKHECVVIGATDWSPAPG